VRTVHYKLSNGQLGKEPTLVLKRREREEVNGMIII